MQSHLLPKVSDAVTKVPNCADMDAGTLVEWLVKPGDRVKRGDVVAVVDTQKGAIEIFEAGKIKQILVDLNTKVPVGTPLARIQTEFEAQPSAVAAAPPRAGPTAPPVAPPGAPPSAPLVPEKTDLTTVAHTACRRPPRRYGPRTGVASG